MLKVLKLFTCLGLLLLNQKAYTASGYGFDSLSMAGYLITSAQRPGGRTYISDWAKQREFTHNGVKMNILVPAPLGGKPPRGTTRLHGVDYDAADNSFVVVAKEEQKGRDVFAAMQDYIISEARKPGSDIIIPESWTRK